MFKVMVLMKNPPAVSKCIDCPYHGYVQNKELSNTVCGLSGELLPELLNTEEVPYKYCPIRKFKAVRNRKKRKER